MIDTMTIKFDEFGTWVTPVNEFIVHRHDLNLGTNKFYFLDKTNTLFFYFFLTNY